MELFLAAVAVAAAAAAAPESQRVLIVMDERPQMEALAHYIKDRGGIESTITDQKTAPASWGDFAAVVAYIHGALDEAIERRIIDYTRSGGRYVCLHHSIS